MEPAAKKQRLDGQQGQHQKQQQQQQQQQGKRKKVPTPEVAVRSCVHGWCLLHKAGAGRGGFSMHPWQAAAVSTWAAHSPPLCPPLHSSTLPPQTAAGAHGDSVSREGE